ncbi:MAG: MBL fold metallo-hydrolase [Candidatus Taylorbacteria bacterium]|nr:MBL fold metallo-hydrolase [Candidatus Taylorbacteria bacterium]
MEMIRKNLHLCFLALLFAATILIWYAVIREDRGGILKIAFLDIGQGDAIYIEAPNGNQMLIDGGPPRTVLSALRKVMPFYDRSIDMLLVTNPDKDHMGGFVDVLKSFKVGEVVEPGTQSPSATYAELEKTIAEKSVPKILAERGQTIWLDKKHGVGFHVLFPDRDVSGLATNNGSIVGRLVYGNTSVMFTGDAPDNIEHYLVLLDGKKLKSDVLKVGHHGSRTSTSEEFVGFISPTDAVISDGLHNKYGHPHQETLATLAQFGVKVFRTDQLGTIVMKTDGENLTVLK